ncbi:class I SAM-dependent methyltransferase [Paraglaciecola chathamensis]|uniref:class I SAM-dependent methyltransferase n=1 Tax=Paraglaciecola chathamensis TaxID=368405 RepID=UPI00270BCA3A|nr:class I SAM-dependent methyltransferase [Paraglaciecola chathamensis]MDO6840748.1 class I SAM-dependent methyltransferase [Paraglaciecola chathamensis]
MVMPNKLTSSELEKVTPVITVPGNASLALIERAKRNAMHWQLDFDENATQGLVLMQSEAHLALKQLDEPKVGEVLVDFASDALTFRRLHGGGKKEAVAKAVGLKGQTDWRVLDATAGLGRDAFVLASLGCNIDMIERSPVVAALLADGLERAQHSPELSAWLPQRMRLHHGIAVELMANWCTVTQNVTPDVVYLDPMFPHRKKSAAVKKEMRLFQQLLGPDEDADALLAPAIALAKKRVVVKRPAGAPFLAQQKPHIEMQGKANRFDVYLINPKAGD